MSAAAVAVRNPIAAAYDHCETLTRRASSNFYWGFRLLPHDRRRALCAVYAFCRSADDIAEEAGGHPSVSRPWTVDSASQLLDRWRDGVGGGGYSWSARQIRGGCED